MPQITDQTKQQVDKQILDIRELSAVTGLSVSAIRKGIKQGMFPAFRVGGHGSKFFIDLSAFELAVRNLGNRNLKHSSEDIDVISISGIRKIKE